MTRRASLTGISTDAPGRGDTQYFAGNSIPLPSGSLAQIPRFEPLNVLQALLDVCALAFAFFFLGILALSPVLAVALMLVAKFH